MGAIREALRMIEAADAPHRPCDQERHEADGGKGQCVHLYDGKTSACGRKAPATPGQAVTRYVDAECADDRAHFDKRVGFYWHRIGFASDPQWVTCLACRDQCAADGFLAGLRAQPDQVRRCQYVFENMGEFSLQDFHYATQLGGRTIDLIIDGYLTTPPNMSVGIALLVATKPHGEMHSRNRLLAALEAQLPEPTHDSRGTAFTRAVLRGFAPEPTCTK